MPMNMNMLGTLPVKEYDFFTFSNPKNNEVKDILHGLGLPQKKIDPKYFYDERGSALYESITKTDDYYLTASENEILSRHALAIAAISPRNSTVIEPGAGNCRKIEFLLGALRPDVYVPVDVSRESLESACSRIAAKYVWLDCIGVVGDFNYIDNIAELTPNRHRIVFFPGSTLGNMEPAAAVQFLSKLRKIIGFEGGILIGVDNVKEKSILNLAYNDRAGITAEFNKNILLSLNATAGTNFVPENFEHKAFFNEEKSRIEMHLVSKHHQTIRLAGESIFIERGETLHTENSYKYTGAAFRQLAGKAGLRCTHTWRDKRKYFTVYNLIPHAAHY